MEVGLPGVELRLNSIGDRTCRPAYIEALRAYFAPLADRLPELERQRLETAPLRLLDSKDPLMQPLIADAPVITDLLCDACRAHFEGVRGTSRRSGSPYGSSRVSCGASITTRAPRSSSIQRGAMASRTRWVVVVDTTGWWSCWAASQRRASASASGSTGWPTR